MTATDELRRLLDERGVEWDYGITGATTTRLSVNGIDLTFTPMRDGVVCSTILTPEQAIAATLGRGTCHPVEQYLDMHSDLTVTVCSNCGVPEDELADMNYCPNCGARVVEVDE